MQVPNWAQGEGHSMGKVPLLGGGTSLAAAHLISEGGSTDSQILAGRMDNMGGGSPSNTLDQSHLGYLK